MAYYETDIPVMSTGGNNGFGFGGDGAWWIIILLLFGWGGNRGFGAGNNGGGDAMYVENAVNRGFDTQTIVSKLDGINNGLCDGFYAQNTNLLTGFGNLSQQVAQCCCDLRAGIAEVNYNMAQNTCAIIQSQKDGTQRIIDYLTTQQLQAVRDENFALRLSASQSAQNAYLIDQLRPTAKPAYLACNPYASAWGYGSFGGFGGCSGNGSIL